MGMQDHGYSTGTGKPTDWVGSLATGKKNLPNRHRCRSGRKIMYSQSPIPHLETCIYPDLPSPISHGWVASDDGGNDVN